MWPFSPNSLNQASHFCMDFCISSGDCAVGSLPRNRKVNSLIVCPSRVGASHLRRLSEAAPDIFLRRPRDRIVGDAEARKACFFGDIVDVCAAATGRLAWSAVEFVYWVLN